MSFYDANGLSAADIAAVTGNGNGNGYGFGNGDSLTFLIILWLFAMMGGNWNGNNGGTVVPEVQAGFDQAAVMGSLNSLSTQAANGFANAEVSRCNTQANLLQAINNLAMNQQNCCCENRQAVSDLKYTVATEACADRQAVSDGIRDLQASGTSNTQSLMNALNAGFQGIQDKLCQQEIESLKTQLQQANMQNYLNNLYSTQNQQTQKILADNALQTAALEQYLAPTPRPAYIVQNPNCCQSNFGCGCGA